MNKEQTKPLRGDLILLRAFLKSCRADQEFHLAYSYKATKTETPNVTVKFVASNLLEVLEEYP